MKPLLKKHEQFTNLLSDNSGFKKGMTAYRVSVWGVDRATGHTKVAIRKLEIQSFGKKQGTAISLENGEFIKRHLRPDITILAHTMEDARQMAEELGLYESGMRIASSLDCKREWLRDYSGRWNAEAVKMAEEEIDVLEGASPSFEIVEA